MKRNHAVLALALAASLSSPLALAGISAEEAARLGGPELTPVGAERAGNADGSIPEWTGGIMEPPPGYEPGGRLVDPFADDKILYTINASNYQQYEEFLSPGQVALIKRYPDTFRMDVYPTRRSAGYSDDEYARIKEGAVNGDMVEGGNGLVNFNGNILFPIPSEGLHVIWNHITRYRVAQAFLRRYTQMPLACTGICV